MSLTHLQRLEAESIHILREVVAECERPVMMYSIGKDSSVMLHLAKKAFAPGRIPFPLLHVDTTWKFREMISFRDQVAQAEFLHQQHGQRGQHALAHLGLPDDDRDLTVFGDLDKRVGRKIGRRSSTDAKAFFRFGNAGNIYAENQGSAGNDGCL